MDRLTRQAWKDTKAYARLHQRIEHEHEVAMASGGWGPLWKVGRQKNRCVADSRRYHHLLMVARDRFALDELKRKARPPSAKRSSGNVSDSTTSRGLAAQKVIMSATLLHNAALDNPFLARMLRKDRIAGDASPRYRRNRHRRLKSAEVETAALAAQTAVVPAKVDEYDDAFDFGDVETSIERERGNEPKGGVSAGTSQWLGDMDNGSEMDWGEDEDESEDDVTGNVSDKQDIAVNGKEGHTDGKLGNVEANTVKIQDEEDDDDVGFDDFIVKSSGGPVVLQMSSSPSKPANTVAAAHGHIPFIPSESQNIGLVTIDQKASAGAGMTFNKELMRWEATGGTAPGDEDFMAGFGSDCSTSSSD